MRRLIVIFVTLAVVTSCRVKQANPSHDKLIGLWWRINEVEPPNAHQMVWRHDRAPRPVARGRHSILFNADGQCEFRPVGGNDAPLAIPGTWQLKRQIIDIQLQNGQNFQWKIHKMRQNEIWISYEP